MSHPDSGKKDLEITLTRGRQRALVGTLGASLRRYWLESEAGQPEWNVIWGYSGTANKKAGQGDVLIPFPSRIKNGRYDFGGKEYQMERNDKEGPNAIHGFVRSETFSVHEEGPATVRFRTQLRPETHAARGYPFPLDVTVTYALEAHGLVTSFDIRNVGDTAAPVGAGFHPYFTVGKGPIDDWEARIPAVRYLDFENLVPTGKVLTVEGTPLDYREPRRVGASRFNHCFAELERDAEGRARAMLRDPRCGREVTIWMDRSFNYLVVYSGDAISAPDTRSAFAIEPLTCATDAFNHPEWGLRVLLPGETFSGQYGISPSGV